MSHYCKEARSTENMKKILNKTLSEKKDQLVHSLLKTGKKKTKLYSKGKYKSQLVLKPEIADKVKFSIESLINFY